MGSVLSEIDCPRCGDTATEDYYYKTDEVYIYCSECGYQLSETIAHDENGIAKKDSEGHYIYILKRKLNHIVHLN